MSKKIEPNQAGEAIPIILSGQIQLSTRGWAITRLFQGNLRLWWGTAGFLRGGPFEGGPDFEFVARGEYTREDCIKALVSLVNQERAKGTWTEIALHSLGEVSP